MTEYPMWHGRPVVGPVPSFRLRWQSRECWYPWTYPAWWNRIRKHWHRDVCDLNLYRDAQAIYCTADCWRQRRRERRYLRGQG